MSSSVFADAFEGARPTLTYNAVSSRLHLSKALTTDLASYYAERAAVEDIYIKSLQKLSSRLHFSSNNAVMTSIDSLGLERKEVERQLGAWKGIQKQLENEVEEQARTSEAWRKKVVEEVEVPLRNSLNKPEWLRYSLMDQTLGGNVRDYENTLDKVQKAQSKGGSKASKSTTSKLLTAQSSLSNLGSTLTSSLPSFLNTAQALDASHSAFLKEALIRYGTINSDIGREQMEVGERMLVSVLGVDEQSEMQGFALREAQKAGARGVGSRNSPSDTTALESSQNSRGELTIGEFGARNDSYQREASIREEETVRTPSTTRERRPEPSRTTSIPRSAPPPVGSLALPTSAFPTTSPAKSSSGGFKLSSFMKRDRAPSNAASSKYGNLDVPSSPVGGNPAGNYSTDNFDRQSFDSRISEQPEEATPTPPASFARTNSNGLAAPARERPTSMFGGKKRDSLMPFGGSLFRKGTVKSPAVEKNQNDGGLSVPGYGGSRGRSDSDTRSARSTTDRSFQEPAESTRGGYSNALGASTSTMMSGAGSTVDSEGFSVPPAGYDKQPWETNGNANLMDDDEDEVSPLPPPKLPALSIAPLTISETSSERQAALERVKSTLLSSKPTNAGPSVSPLGIAPPASGLARRTTRGRRDGRMSTYSPVIPDDVPLGRILEQQRHRDSTVPGDLNSSTGAGAYAGALPSSPIANSFGNDATGRSNSIVSSVSSSSRMGKSGAIDPFETATTPGLRASIVETVNVLSKAGEISRVMIVGELALSNRVVDGDSGPLHIRLANYDRFEKAVPNSAYLSPVVDSPGEFVVKEALGASTTTVMKYQLRIPEGEEKDYLPLLVRASWKVEVGSAKVMVVYEGNSGAKLIAAAGPSPFGEEEGGSIQFDELSFHVPFSLSLSTFQSKPSAQYSADKNRLTFVPEDKTLVGGESRKLLVSAVTDGNGVVSTQPVSVNWKITGKVVSGINVEVVKGGTVEEVATSIVSGKFLVAQ